ncbi:MAG TPA: glutamyl-tRNA reductase [Actinomycetota bacterium]|nr:glutamyl-tRNA reductase [Actinomycetota bacterium]
MIIALSAGREAPAGLRSRLALDEPAQREVLRASRSAVAELVVLSTCHRTELYAAVESPVAEAVHSVAALLPGLQPTDSQDLRLMEGAEAVEHLFRVASGLDSLVVGEPQVLGQVRRGFVLAQEEDAVGPVLANILGRAIRLGRQVRSDTPLGRNAGSIGSLTAGFLITRLDGLKGRAGCVIGTGEAARDAACELSAAGADLTVVGRRLEPAQSLASELNSKHADVSDLKAVLSGSDFAVVAVSGGPVLTSEHVPARPLVVVDLSVPRAVEAIDRPGLEVRCLEDIPVPGRWPEGLREAEDMVRREVAELELWADTRAAGPSILALRARAESIVREEVRKAAQSMDAGPDEAQRMAQMALRIANKILHGPLTALRRADPQSRELIERMFGLDRPVSVYPDDQEAADA